MCAKLLFELYGKWTAANSWEREYTKTLIEAMFSPGRANKCTFYHAAKGVRIVVHGDDFVVTGSPVGLEFVENPQCKVSRQGASRVWAGGRGP